MIDIIAITLMPGMFEALTGYGVVGDAFAKGKARLRTIDPRSYAADERRTVDDSPYGGGPGMVLKPEPMAQAIDAAKAELPQAQVCLLSPAGKVFDAADAVAAAEREQHIFVCGRYLGIDQRVIDSRIDCSVSLGNFITSGGELPAMAVIEAIMRHVPGVLGCGDSPSQDSFATPGTLAPPCYTRPAAFEGVEVPPVLLGGDHAAIERWRKEQAEARTAAWRARQQAEID